MRYTARGFSGELLSAQAARKQLSQGIETWHYRALSRNPFRDQALRVNVRLQTNGACRSIVCDIKSKARAVTDISCPHYASRQTTLAL